MIGETIGSYRVVAKLGEGGMGAVYVAHHTLLGRKAAIKVLLPSLSRQPEVVERFFNEARAVTTMSDPGIVQIFDFGYAADGSAFIVMELLEGEPLNVRLAQRGRLGAVEALRIGRQVAVSLATAHGHGIVHRDLKPENVFMVRDAEIAHGERAKVLDFGIAKLSGAGNSSKTSTGALLGTPTYMSPEQCRGAGEVDHRSDIYALGCMLFHLLTGAPPFLGEGIGDVIAAHLREPAPAPSSRVPGLPPALDALVLRCLAKAAAERFASMQELAAAIDQLLLQQASAEQVTYMMPAAGVTPYPVVRRGSYPGAPLLPLPPLSSSPSLSPWPGTPPPSPSQSGAGPAAGSHPGTVALNLPTTLGSAAGSRAAQSLPTHRTAGRSLRWLGGAGVLGVAVAVLVFVAIQRGGGGGGVQAAQPGDVATAAPSSEGVAPVDAGVAAGSPLAPDAAPGIAPVDAAVATAPPLADAGLESLAPATAATAAPADAAPKSRSRHRRARDRRGDGCDRAVDPDCDGIPDVR